MWKAVLIGALSSIAVAEDHCVDFEDGCEPEVVCQFGKNADGICIEEPVKCEFGTTADGICKEEPVKCENGTIVDNICIVKPPVVVCKFGKNADGICIEEPVKCVNGKTADGNDCGVNGVYIQDFVTDKYINEANEAEFLKIRETGRTAGSLSSYATYRLSVAQRAVIEAKLRLRNATANLNYAKNASNKSRATYYSLQTALEKYSQTETNVETGSSSNGQARLAAASAAVAKLRAELSAATAVQTSLAYLDAAIARDNEFQSTISAEINRLHIRASTSAANSLVARTKRDGNIRLLSDLQVSLEAAIKAQAAAKLAFSQTESNSSSAYGSAQSSWATYQARVEAQKLVVATDSRSVWSAENSLAQAQAALQASIVAQKTSVEDAAHAAWHKTVRGETTMGSVNAGTEVQGRSQIDLINASWARIRATEAEVVTARSNITMHRGHSEALWAQVKVQQAIVVDQTRRAGVDVTSSSADKMACEARNAAAVAQNAKSKRNAEGSATYVCDADNVKCKWMYNNVYLADEENCEAQWVSNHTKLAQEASAAVLRLTAEARAMDQVVSQWVFRLADAEARAKQARSARHSVAATVLTAQDYSISAEQIAAADASLASMRDQARLIGQRTARNILNTKITVVPREHA